MTHIPMSRALQWISAIIIGFGIVLCLMYMSEFHDRNIGLMVGIGFLVGGLQILLFSAAAPLMLKLKPDEPAGRKATGEV